MTLSKIQLSDAETELICNADLILTKNKALEKIRSLLEQAQWQMQQYVTAHQLQADALFQNPPKISRGELYRGLPWMILDYPRIFTREGIFAIRSMFWWGHFFSSTLHISGTYKNETTLSAAHHSLQHHYIGVNADPWHHHFEKDNYQPIKKISEPEWRQQLRANEHIKVAAAWPLTNWKTIPDDLFGNWREMLALFSYPGGETDPSPDNPKASPGP
jgi:hypothetical protein